MKDARYLLHSLLDKYENSASYKGEPRNNRRIWLHFTRSNLPRYFDDSTARHKESLNEAARLLEDRGLIEIVWERFEEGNLISKIALNTARLNGAYDWLGRLPREVRESHLAGLARHHAQGAAPWAAAFMHWVAERAQRGESVARYLDLNDPDRATLLFKAVREAAQLGEEVPRRVFSQRVLGSTKAFDQVAGAVARVAAEFNPHLAGAAAEPEDILAELGVVDNPQHIFISGGLKFEVAGRPIDVSDFYPDLGISTEMTHRLEITAVPADYVITIENLTAFYSFIKNSRDNCLAIYLGGYHNSHRRSFLLKLKDFLAVTGQAAPFYHWGDIDYGGFSIFVHLRDSCLPDLKPLLMDVGTLENYAEFCLPFNQSYANKLRLLLENERHRVFHPVIRYMLANGVRLEQECVDPVAEPVGVNLL